MSTGLSHITFITADLERMQQIMQQVFKAQLVYASGADQFSLSEERFYLIGDIWLATMQGFAICGRAARVRTERCPQLLGKTPLRFLPPGSMRLS